MRTLVLDATTKSITIALAAAHTSAASQIITSWMDNNGTVQTEGSTEVSTNGTSDVVAVAAPGASTRRTIKHMSIHNTDTGEITALIKSVNTSGSVTKQITKVTLLVGETWTTDGTYDVAGGLKFNSTVTTIYPATATFIIEQQVFL